MKLEGQVLRTYLQSDTKCNDKENDVLLGCEIYDSNGVLRIVEIFSIVTVRKRFSAKATKVLMVLMSPCTNSDARVSSLMLGPVLGFWWFAKQVLE